MLEKKLSQKDIASVAGVTPPSVNEWKAKGTMPRADTAIILADFFKVSPKWLVMGKEEPEMTNAERGLLENYRLLDGRDQDDVAGIIRMKLEAAKRGDILSSSGNA
ncbi:hypothetical protein FACS189450_03350 [Spirochaetia bacterium]|nr:hypothetical protein FACS189450_03350 [Spirochaetia bacterium]